MQIIRRNETAGSDFAYADEYTEECKEFEVEYMWVLIFVLTLVVIVVIALVTIVLFVRYKKRYYQMLAHETAEDKREVDTGRPISNADIECVWVEPDEKIDRPIA